MPSELRLGKSELNKFLTCLELVLNTTLFHPFSKVQTIACSSAQSAETYPNLHMTAINTPTLSQSNTTVPKSTFHPQHTKNKRKIFVVFHLSIP